MAAFMAVDSQPGPGYGRLEILQLPQNTGIDGPQQVHGDFESDTSASGDLSLWRKGGSTVTFGNLVTVPLGGGLLSTQPLYVSSRRRRAPIRRSSGSSPTSTARSATRPRSGRAGPGARHRDRRRARPAGRRAAATSSERGAVTTPRRRRALPRSFAAFGADLAKMNAALEQAEKVAARRSGGAVGRRRALSRRAPPPPRADQWRHQAVRSHLRNGRLRQGFRGWPARPARARGRREGVRSELTGTECGSCDVRVGVQGWGSQRGRSRTGRGASCSR